MIEPQPATNQQYPGKVYALLVGIDEYQLPVKALSGCVNDISLIQELLLARVGGSFVPLSLLNAEAARQAVIDGFRKHLAQAGAGDVALFYYSGHGAQEKADSAFWNIEPDHLNETIVCYDSRQPGSWNLADKELAQLIHELAAKNPQIVVVLDSCHSGSGTRALEEVGVRRGPTDQRERKCRGGLPMVQKSK